MSAVVGAPARSFRDTSERAALPAVLAALAAAAVALQVHFGPIGDVSWLITVDEKWLAGARPYVDVIETNPPPALLLYWPGVALAQLTGIAPEFWVAATGFAAVAAILALCAAILKRAKLIGALGPATLAATLVATTILPGRAFDERDFFVGLACAPFVALAAARGAGGAVGLVPALIGGLLLAFAIALKPPYALIVVATAPSVLRRVGLARALKVPEIGAALIGLGAFAGVVAIGFPDYFAGVLPVVAAVYAPAREPLLTLVLNAGVLIALILGAALAVIAGPRIKSPLVAALALAALGTLAVYFVQGKGWLYQIEPALAFLVVAVGLALDGASIARRELFAALLTGLAALAAALALGRWQIQIAILAGVAAAPLARRLAPQDATRDGGAVVMAATIAAAATGVLCALFFQSPDGERDRTLERALSSLKPRPTIATISEGLGLGHPLVRDVGGVWAQRTQGLLMAAAARRRIADHPDDAELRKRMEAAVRADRDLLVEDIRRNRPDAILVGPLGTRFHAWAWSDPELTAARADYQFYAANADPDFPAELYVRKDLIGLKPSDANVAPHPAVGEPERQK